MSSPNFGNQQFQFPDSDNFKYLSPASAGCRFKSPDEFLNKSNQEKTAAICRFSILNQEY